MKIGLLGGTFDPVHTGHLIIAEWALAELDLDKVIFIPNNAHPFNKRSDISPAAERIMMLSLALQNYSYFEISDYEIEKGGVSYTVDTISHFYKKYPGSEFYYIIGADNVAAFQKWKDPHKIAEISQIVVFKREGIDVNTATGQLNFIKLDNPQIEISSSMIRKRIAQRKQCNTMLPNKVYEYIHAKQLYIKSAIA